MSACPPRLAALLAKLAAKAAQQASTRPETGHRQPEPRVLKASGG